MFSFLTYTLHSRNLRPGETIIDGLAGLILTRKPNASDKERIGAFNQNAAKVLVRFLLLRVGLVTGALIAYAAESGSDLPALNQYRTVLRQLPEDDRLKVSISLPITAH